MIEYVLTFIAYGAIVLAIVLFMRGTDVGCNRDCRQGSDCEDK